MSVVDVDNVKSKFLSKICDLYNQEVFFIDSCMKFPSKYSLEQSITDDSLRIFFLENNKVVIDGQLVEFCEDEVKRNIKLSKIESEDSDFEINNYIVENTWKKTDW